MTIQYTILNDYTKLEYCVFSSTLITYICTDPPASIRYYVEN